ncbi:maleylpyruvate isomerase family mycothiol-dependent enzyme [Brevibacterium sp. CBA3109]|uniref:Maleylpyruvate isomerase family mycothiol-dependent enzyme n=1 Tax=Brevibacterium koreense TaxID=3140787 RepID=A0AAU7UHU8_9MICO
MNTHRDDPSNDLIRTETIAERSRLADLLTGLDHDQWSTPSLCEGWQVREVVAHLTMAYRYNVPRLLLGLARSGFRFNAYADRAAQADTSALSDTELLESLSNNIGTPWTPPGGGVVGALSHDIIHGLDITEPLGLPPSPPERIRLVLNNVTRKTLAYFGVELTGRRLVAEDVDLELGTGTHEMRMSAREMLMAMTGRVPLPDL